MAEIEVPLPEVVAQDNMTVGDENLEVRKVEPEVVNETAKSQVSPPRGADAASHPVHEVSVALDEVITDPNSPLAVQVPDAGRGDASLPIHRLAEGTPEDQFASAKAPARSKASDKPSE